ncbi:MAG TPA: DPP IV N-terminal domain-containing protein, partial [Thermoguttaceae bacterium]|nr:DPP IV N-terminal domain-containing protein [Thermoguttaceae bacterium]
MRVASTIGCLLTCFLGAIAAADSPGAGDAIRLAGTPALSPDGRQLVFSWRGDLWLVSSDGGRARRLTSHPARDVMPAFSPDGKRLAFTSDRTGSPQIYVMDLREAEPRQWTFHGEGSVLEEWSPDGRELLVSGQRDHYWQHPERFFRIDAERRAAPRLVFDDYGADGNLSPDGKKLLFTREGEKPWRQGYRGPRASQIWLYDLAAKTFEKVLDDPTGAASPRWMPDGRGFYYTSERAGSRNLWRYDFKTGRSRQLTHLTDSPIVSPCVSRDGKMIVFAHLFDLYRWRPGGGRSPERLEITCPGDALLDPVLRRSLATATDAAFSSDGLEIAMIAGGDLWVMDTELREPRRVTDTPEEERDPVFAPDGKSILVVSDADEQSDVWRVTRAEASKYWWENDEFVLSRLTLDAESESELKWSPDGKLVALVKGRGDLWVMRPDGKEARRVMRSATPIGFDWSPDGKWLVYGIEDTESNRDVWIAPLDGSRKPINISCHPDVDTNPVWSPDGKVIAFTGRRTCNEIDICFVYLQEKDDQTGRRDRTVERAKMKMDRGRGKTNRGNPAAAKQAGKSKGLAIDFEGIDRRVRRVSLPDVNEQNLFWSPDSKQLAFAAKIDGRQGTYTISPPDDLRPKLLNPRVGSRPKWIAAGNQIL